MNGDAKAEGFHFLENHDLKIKLKNDKICTVKCVFQNTI